MRFVLLSEDKIRRYQIILGCERKSKSQTKGENRHTRKSREHEQEHDIYTYKTTNTKLRIKKI